MDTNSKREEIIRRLNLFREDPELRDFWPLYDEMLNSIDNPEFEPAKFEALFKQCLYNNVINTLAEGLYINSTIHSHRQNWYEYDKD